MSALKVIILFLINKWDDVGTFIGVEKETDFIPTDKGIGAN